jgi:replicative DNA helicase
MVGREMPHSLESEVAVLGSILLRPTSIEKVIDIIRPGDFYRGAHRTIYEAMVRLYNDREAIDIVTLTTELEKQSQLESAGGVEYLAELSEAVPTSHNIVSYANIIADKAMLRDLLETTWEIIDEGYSATREVREIVDEAERKVFEVGQREIRITELSTEELVNQSLDQTQQNMKNYKAGVKTVGVPSGFIDLDHITKGFMPGEVIMIAARPSMGKTSFALNIAMHMAINLDLAVEFFSLEMKKEILILRMQAMLAGVDFTELKVGNITDDEWRRINHAAGKIAKAPIFIHDKFNIKLEHIWAKCRRRKTGKKRGVICIDYLQKITPINSRIPREQQVSKLSGMMKDIAGEMNCPVIILSQLNRGVENRDDKRPRMADIRESGATEQDADIMFMLYREVYYFKQLRAEFEKNNNLHTWKLRMAEIVNQAEGIIAKYRNGQSGGVIPLHFDGPTMNFSGLSGRDAPADSDQRDFLDDEPF